MSDKTKPGRSLSSRAPLAVEVYFDQQNQAAGASLAPQRGHTRLNKLRTQPGGPAPLAFRRARPSDHVIGHIAEDAGAATITMRPGDPWGFGSILT